MKKWIFILFCLWLFSCSVRESKQPPNILFIAVDDLRPELNCYGASHIQSPNIDRLSQEGVRFERAYCNVPVCGASRACLMTGIKPSRSRFVTYSTWAERDLPGAISMPGYFRSKGYHTLSNGKVFHHRADMERSWSEKPWYPEDKHGNWRNYNSKYNIDIATHTDNGRAWPFEAIEVEDEAYFDGKIAEKTIADLRRLKDMGAPFFLATGFLKPHLPFTAPKKYWDQYDRSAIALPRNYFRPAMAPEEAIHSFGELRGYYGVPSEGPVSDSMAIGLIHGYYACVSYTDAQIGKVLAALKELDLDKSTIVVLWGDHGWQLGEHTLWCKHSNFDLALRIPLIIKAPGFKKLTSEALVETIDLFPTLCDLAGLDIPAHLHGQSLAPVMKAPQTNGREVIYSRFHDGESIKTDRYLYTEWRNEEGATYARMLYDHRNDPGENVNIADEKSNKEIVEDLSALLHIEIEKAKKVQLVQ